MAQWKIIQLPIQETRVRSLGRVDPLEKEMATHSSMIAWRTLNRGDWQATVLRLAKSQTQLSTHAHKSARLSLFGVHTLINVNFGYSDISLQSYPVSILPASYLCSF